MSSKPRDSPATNGTTPIQVKPRKTSQVEDCGCDTREKDTNMIDDIPCCGKLHDKFCFKLFVFLLVFGLDAADLISDWLLYNDVSQTEEGLVYGPVNDATKYSLLTFSIIGSFTFTFEVANLWWDIFRRNPWIDTDLLSAITVWIEDVPQIIINVLIVACREDAVSYFQLVKASVIILGAVIRVVLSLFKYCSKKAIRDLECAGQNKESCRHVTYRVFIMIGLLITLGGAIVIFLFTQVQRNNNGSLNFKVPSTIVEGEWDDSKYFNNVSIYFSHPLLDQPHTGTLQGSQVNWIRLASITDIRNHDGDTIVTVTHENITSNNVKLFIEQDGSINTDCLQYNRGTNTLSTSATCTAMTGTTFIFQFHYIKPKHPVLIFGDITYNVRIQTNTAGQCSQPDSAIYDNIDDRIQNTETEKNAAVHYFRTNDQTNDQNHVIHGGTNNQFYHSADLIDITEVWRVGFASCKSSGSLAPHWDVGIKVKCP